MTTIIYAVLLAILVLWAILLGLAIRKRRYCPHFVSPLTTKLFWIFTFFFINPLLIVLYVIFGLFRNSERRPIPLVVVVAIVIILAGFVVNIPGVTHLWMQPFIARNADPDASLKARAAAIESRTAPVIPPRRPPRTTADWPSATLRSPRANTRSSVR